MERCRFCLENIEEEAFSCKHCGQLQPTKEEINSAYRHVLSTLVKETLGEKKWKRVNFLRRVAIFSFYLFVVLFIVFGITYMFKLSWIDGLTGTIWGSLFVSFFLMLLSGTFGGGTISKYRTKLVFEKALLIEERLQNKLREMQIKKLQPYKSLSQSSLVILGVLLLLAISNPSTNEFKEFYKQTNNFKDEPNGLTKINLVICSRYQINGATYWGVLGNFF